MDSPASQSSTERSILSKLFISEDERRLRAGWRLALHSLFTVSIMFLFGIPVVLATVFFSGSANADRLASSLFLSEVILFPAILISTWVARRFLDRRSFRSLGLKIDRRALFDILLGFIIPALLMGLIFLVELATGWLTINGGIGNGMEIKDLVLGIGGSLILYLLVGIGEEILSRGYHLQNLAEGLNLPAALLLSSGVFAFLHVGNPHATLISTLGILAAGFFLAYGWVRTGSLWLPIGLHIGWNFFQGTIFGFPVSGTQSFHLIDHQVTGPVWVTGGEFGPEAGLIVLPAMLLGTWIIWLYTRGRKSVRSRGT
jgi:uncharacterized protein